MTRAESIIAETTRSASANARVGLAEVHRLGVEHVGADVLEQRREGGVSRLVHRDHGVERLVVDLDRVPRILGQVAALGDDEGDRITDVADLPVRERTEHGTQVVGDLRLDPKRTTRPRRARSR